MKYHSVGTSIVEAMIIMLIVVLGIVGMYDIFSSSQKLSESTNHRIEAIQIAREGIEAVMNIRDTNALLFQADLQNCWNVSLYNGNCIADISFGSDDYDIPHMSSFVVYQDETFRWVLVPKTYTGLEDYINPQYREKFRVAKNNDFYTQTGGTDFFPLYTREIKIIYLNDNLTPASDSNTNKMQVQSIVRWIDGTSKKPYEVSLDTVLTNWKKGY